MNFIRCINMIMVKTVFKLTITILVFGFISLSTAEKAIIGQPAPNFELISSMGKSYSLDQFKGKIVVLEWINFGCPFVKKHYKSANMQKLQKLYTEKDVVWLSICSSAPGKQGHLNSPNMKKKLAGLGYKGTAYLIDETGTIGKLYGAKTTPHMFVINQKGILVYDGAIDSKASARISDIDSAENYVASTLDLLLRDKEFKPYKTAPYGCSVKYK